jgi:hypothetical protein
MVRHGTPTYRGKPLTESLFRTAFVLLLVQDLKDAGLVKGGPWVDRDGMEKLVAAGKKAGYSEPTAEQSAGIIQTLNAMWEKKAEEDK